MRFLKCEFCQKWDFEKVNFVKKWDFEKVNFVKIEISKVWILSKNEISKVWILCKLRFWKCEFCQKWEFENVNVSLHTWGWDVLSKVCKRCLRRSSSILSMAVALESQSACSIDAGDAGGKVVAPIWTFADEATRGGGDDDWATPTLTGFVFRSAMNLERHGSLKKWKHWVIWHLDDFPQSLLA